MDRTRPSVLIACIDCGKERRVRIDQISPRCHSCANHETERKKRLGLEVKRAGRKNGNKAQLPSSYDGGYPAVNFFLAILNRSKEDKSQMWQDFQKTELYGQGLKGVPDSLQVAWWVSNYIGG